jgi:hypothetical protein
VKRKIEDFFEKSGAMWKKSCNLALGKDAVLNS